MGEIIIKNGLAYHNNGFEKIDLKISGCSIVEISKNIDSKDCETFDAEGIAIIPGFVNTHTHIAMSVLRGVAEDLSFNDWLFGKILKLEERLTPEIVYWASLLSMMEMASFGTVAFCDMYFHTESIAQAVKDFGLKALLTRGLVDNNGDDNGRLEENLKLYRDWSGTENRIFVGLGPHAPYTCSKEYLKRIVERAKIEDIPVVMHFFENSWEREKYSVKEIIELGFDKVHFIPVHCVNIEEDEFSYLKNSYVSLNPVSNMKLGNEFPKISEMVDFGLNVTFGTDGPASNNSQNILFDTRVAVLLGKRNDPTRVPLEKVFDSVTELGQRALRMNGGKIEVGKDADLVFLKLDEPQLQPNENLLENIIHSYTEKVYGTMVRGRFVYLNGEYPTIDKQEVLEKFSIFYKKVIGTEN